MVELILVCNQSPLHQCDVPRRLPRHGIPYEAWDPGQQNMRFPPLQSINNTPRIFQSICMICTEREHALSIQRVCPALPKPVFRSDDRGEKCSDRK